MKLRVRFLQLPVLFDAGRLAREVAAIPEAAWRPHPQGYPGNDALALITTDGDPASDARGGAMGPTPHLLACPYLMQVLDALGATWGRSRLMRLSGAAEVTPHVDTDYYWRDHMRVHVPIVTQPTVRFLCGGEQVNMAAGECWIFDTWSLHSVHNDATRSRIHLVADTVGGRGMTTLMEQGRPAGERRPGWAPKLAPPRDGPLPKLAYESRNVPAVMTPWELRDHVSFLMSELRQPGPQTGAAGQILMRLRNNWHALWARSGDEEAAWPEYSALLEETWPALEAVGVASIPLKNGMSFGRCLRALVFESALGGRSKSMDAETRATPVGTTAPIASARRSASRDPIFDRPLFIVSPPRSGSTLLFETLSGAPGLATVGGESHNLMEQVPAINPAARGWDFNRLTAADADSATVEALRARFRAALRDRAGSPVEASPVRMLEKTPKNALRVPFLAAAFPEARFIYLHRDPRPTLASMIEGWKSGQFRTYPNLPGWRGLDWSFLLIPGWRRLIGAPLEDIVAHQWATTTRILRADLESVPKERWTICDYERLLEDPRAAIMSLCSALDVAWDREIPASLPLSRHTYSPPDAEKWRRYKSEIERTSPIWSPEDMWRTRLHRVSA
jgi:LPS sulfotransferase NodH